MAEEQVNSSPETKPESEQTKTPPRLAEAIGNFMTDQAKQAAEAKAKEAPGEGKPEVKTKETKPKEGPKPEKKETKSETEEGKKEPIPSSLTFVDEGTEVTLDLTKEEDVEKAKTWLGQGKRFSQHKQSLNEREALIGTEEEVLKAVREGRLVPIDKVKPPGEPEQAPPEIDLGDLADDYPEVAKLFKTQQKTIDEQGKALHVLGESFTKQWVGGVFDEMKGLIEEAKKEHPLANDTEIWNMLKQVDKVDKPVYTIPQAVKISHDNQKKTQEGHIESDGYVKLTDEMKEQIVIEAKEKEAELNAAPVISPSGLPAGSGVPPSSKGKKITGVGALGRELQRFVKETAGSSKAKEF